MNNVWVLPDMLLCGGANPRNLISLWVVRLPYTRQMQHLTSEF